MLYLPPQKLLLVITIIFVLLSAAVVILPNDSWWHDALQIILAIGFLTIAIAHKKGLLSPNT